MLVNNVWYTFAPDKVDAAIELLIKLRDASLAEPGCRGYTISRGNDDPTTVVLYEEWEDAEALQAHYQAPHFKELGILGIRPLALRRVNQLCTPL